MSRVENTILLFHMAGRRWRERVRWFWLVCEIRLLLNLNSLLNLGLLEVTLALNLGTGGVDIGTGVELEELAEIELGGLEDLDLADEDITEGVDRLAGLLNLVSDNLGDELVDELLQVAGGSLGNHDLEHLLANLTDLGRLSIGGLLDLVDTLLGEGNSEEAEQVTIGGLDIDVGLDDGLLFITAQ